MSGSSVLKGLSRRRQKTTSMWVRTAVTHPNRTFIHQFSSWGVGLRGAVNPLSGMGWSRGRHDFGKPHRGTAYRPLGRVFTGGGAMHKAATPDSGPDEAVGKLAKYPRERR